MCNGQNLVVAKFCTRPNKVVLPRLMDEVRLGSIAMPSLCTVRETTNNIKPLI